MNRRQFLQLLGGASSLAPITACVPGSDAIGKLLPKRYLGSSSISVTCLGLGGYHIGWTTEELAQATIEAALDEGVRFFDTAEAYGPHTSEERYGRYLVPKYRDHIFLMTKSMATDAATARQDIEDSLRRLKTDHVDLWQIHSLFTPEDADKRLNNGVLAEALKARDEGKISHIGFTGHASPYAHMRMLERTGGDPEPFLTCQFPINPVDAASSHSYITTVLPAVQQRGLGIIAMKTLADGRFFPSKVMKEKTVWQSDNPIIPGQFSIGDCIHFALSLPVSVLVTGAENPEFIREKASLLRAYAGMGETTRAEMTQRAAIFAAEGRVEYYKAAELRS